MAWKLRFDPRTQRDLTRLDHAIRKRIVRYLEERVMTVDHPKELANRWVATWRDVGDIV